MECYIETESKPNPIFVNRESWMKRETGDNERARAQNRTKQRQCTRCKMK